MEVKISAKDAMRLRKATGAGMMDCKKALVETEGDFDAAIDLLRKTGQKLSAKRADRSTNEGVVIAQTSADGKQGIVMKLGCETDFVAKNEDFVAFAKNISDLGLSNFPESQEALLNLAYNDELTIHEKVTEQIGVIGEKLEISGYNTAKAEQVVAYIHAGYRIGVLLSLNQTSNEAIEAGKNVAMQVAAMNPVAVDKDGVDASVIEKEIEIGKEVARNEGKPEAMLEKIAMGKLQKFYKENTLLNQKYVRNNKVTVQQYLESVSKGLTVTEFKRVALA